MNIQYNNSVITIQEQAVINKIETYYNYVLEAYDQSQLNGIYYLSAKDYHHFINIARKNAVHKLGLPILADKFRSLKISFITSPSNIKFVSKFQDEQVLDDSVFLFSDAQLDLFSLIVFSFIGLGFLFFSGVFIHNIYF
ncbi:MAG: hypothetical protein COB22_08665 [Cycloclasticus sp.]|nr:MAG: hypothetical protein COB22_08665 [Cycloclasticus sp.]